MKTRCTYDRRGFQPMTFREEAHPTKKRPKALPRTTRAWKYKALVDTVRDYIQKAHHSVRVGQIAWKLRAKPAMVKKAMYQMVREGLLHAPSNRSDYGWHASSWMKRKRVNDTQDQEI